MVAAEKISINSRDFDSARSKLRNLERKPAKRVLTKSVRAGGGPILRAARKGVPVQTETLKRSLRQKMRFYGATGTSLAVIGTTKGKDAKSDRTPSNYLHLVENNTKPHEITVSGKFAARQGRGRPGALSIPTTPTAERTGNLLPLELRFAKKVRHPGTTGKKFIANAARSARGQAAAKFTAKFTTEVTAEVRKA